MKSVILTPWSFLTMRYHQRLCYAQQNLIGEENLSTDEPPWWLFWDEEDTRLLSQNQYSCGSKKRRGTENRWSALLYVAQWAGATNGHTFLEHPRRGVIIIASVCLVHVWLVLRQGRLQNQFKLSLLTDVHKGISIALSMCPKTLTKL